MGVMRWMIGGIAAAALAALAVVTILDPGPDPGRETSESSAAGDAAPSLSREGGELLAAGRTDEAYGRYLAAVEEDPDDREARLGLTLIALLRQDLGDAAFHGGEAIRLAPSDPAAEAVEAALDLLRDPAAPGAAEIARGALRDDPGNLIARWAVIRSLLDGGDPCGAIPEIDAAIAEAPRSYEFEEMRLAAFSRAGDGAGGGAQMVRMHRKFPDSVKVRRWLFDWYEATGDTEAATALLREEAEGGDVAANLRLVDYVRRTRGEEAGDAELARLADRAAETPEGEALAGRYRAELASSLTRQGRTDEAIATLEDVVALPALPPQDANDARTSLARLLHARGTGDDRERAASLVAGVLEADPGHEDALLAQAGWFIETGKAGPALEALRVALGQNPRSPAILTLMGAAYQLEGSDAMAADSLARAVEITGGGAAETEAYARFLRARGRDAVADALVSQVAEAEPAPAPAPAPARAPADTSNRCPAPATR